MNFFYVQAISPAYGEIGERRLCWSARLLRLLLGQNFKPISTELLAALIKMKPVSVRGIEANRRELNADDRTKIAIYAGAEWDTETHQWVCAGSGKGKKIPFDRLEHEVYTSRIDSGRALVRGNQAVFEKSVEFLLKYLSAKEANIAMLRLHHLILDIAKENGMDADGLEYLEEHIIIQDPVKDRFPVRITEGSEKPIRKRSKKQLPSFQ